MPSLIILSWRRPMRAWFTKVNFLQPGCTSFDIALSIAPNEIGKAWLMEISRHMSSAFLC